MLDGFLLGAVAARNPHSLVCGLGDRNHMTARQRELYDRLQSWGVPLLPAGESTYQLRNGKHRWLAWLGMAEPQLDGIHLRVPEPLELTSTQEGVELDHRQVGYTTDTMPVASDHLAVRTLIRLPAPPTHPVPQPVAFTSFERLRYRSRGAAYTFLHFDNWMRERPGFARLPRSAQLAMEFFAVSIFRNMRYRAGGVQESVGYLRDLRNQPPGA